MKSSQSFFNEFDYYITPSELIEFNYCKRFTYYMKCLNVPQFEENRFKVQKGKEIHSKKENEKKQYLRKKLGVIDKKINVDLYSEKYKSVDEIPEGSQIAVMNDATNEDVSLKILEEAGLIKLADDVDLATVADIVDNPKNLEIVEMEQAQTVTALEDMAAACCWFTHMSAAGKDPSSYIVRDNVMVNYPMGVITKGDDVQSDWAVAMAECLRDSDVQKKINETYPNVFEFYTSDDQVKE